MNHDQSSHNGQLADDTLSSPNPFHAKDIQSQMIPFEIQTPPIYEMPSRTKATNGSEMLGKNLGKQVRMVIVICMTILFYGFNRTMIAATVNSQTTKEFEKLFNFQWNVITTKAMMSCVSAIGAVFGTILCSFLLKFTSPKQIILNSSVIAIIFTVVSMYEQIIIFLIFKFSMGWIFGIYLAVVPSYIKQVTSKDYAPYFGTATSINETLGTFLSFLFGFGFWEATLSVRDNWVIMSCISLVPLIVIVVCIKIDFVYDSPMYLMKTLHDDQALAIYQQLYQEQYVRAIFAEKQIELKRFYLNQLKMFFKREQLNFLKRKDILIGIHLPILRKTTGNLVIMISSGSMLKSIHPQFERKAPIFICLVACLCPLLSNILIKYLSRRMTFQIGTVCCCILNCLLAFGYLFEIPAVALLVFKVLILVIYGLTIGPLVYTYLPEVVPARIIPLAQIMNWVIDAITLPLPGVIMAHNGNAWPLFFVFFLWDLLSIVVNHFLLVQTKKKTILQIIQSLDKKGV